MVERHLTLRCDADRVDVEFLRDRLYVARTLVPHGYETYFRQRARYKSVHSSVAIEGNKIGEQQALLVLIGGPDESEPQQVELRNLDEAYELIQQIAQDKTVRVDEGLIRTMNSLILRGLPDQESRARGRYRTIPTLIVNSQTRAVRYRPPPPEWVPELMEMFVADIQRWLATGSYPGPIVAALAHFGLISIHPFTDGNGRTARLLSDMILQKTGWSAEGMIAVDAALLARQAEYYDILRSTQSDDYKLEVDVTPFVEFQMHALESAAIVLEEGVVEFRRRRDSFIAVTAGTLNERQALAFMFMMDLSHLSTSTYAELTGSSQSSAYYDLMDMIRGGWVERVGKGRNTRYRIKEELRKTLEAQVDEEKAE